MAEFNYRRKKLIENLEDNSCVIIHSGVSKITSEDEFYPFTPNKDFLYLTGIWQENSTLILVKALNTIRTFLFVEPYSELKEKWTGKRLTLTEASSISDIHDVYDNTTLESKIDLLLKKGSLTYGEIKNLYIDDIPELKISEEKYEQDFASKINETYPHIVIKNVHEFLIRQRMVKSKEEVNNIREAIKATAHGINHLLTIMKPNMFEYQLSGEFFNFGYQNGKMRLAFDTITASGINATCLHYPQQLSRIKENELVLFDLGYKYEGYSADISRTYPISGKFDDLQRNIYEAVLMCNKAVIEYVREGLTLKDLQTFTIDFYLKELPKRGLLKEGATQQDLLKVYYHGVSHHLGLDTHDVCFRELPLQEGNVITIEPGLYFAEYGIGVRIEDDVLITKEGCEVLSRDILKEVKQIETYLGGK